MIAFDKCSYCTQVSRVQFYSTRQGADESPLEDLQVQVTVNDRYYRCGLCGTYYRFESNFMGSSYYRLVRITIIEALAAFQSDFRTIGNFEEAYRGAINSGLCQLKRIRGLMKSQVARAREFAAETMADNFKKQDKIDGIRTLLQNQDAETRLGALWSYAEIPWYSYMADDPRLDTWNGIFHYKPYGKLSSILKYVFILLYDPDKRIRILARNFIKQFFLGKGQALTTKLQRIPMEKWSVEIKGLLIEENYPFKDNESFTELCNFLIDPEEWVRKLALSRVYEMYSEKSIPDYIEYIKILSNMKPTEQTEWFLAHPYAGLEKDMDDD
jgi:hypothetical protein